MAVYLTYEHYSGSASLVVLGQGDRQLPGSDHQHLLEVPGIPVADLGLVFFAVMLALQLPYMWRPARADHSQCETGVGHRGPRIGFYLLYTELFRIDAICLWCTAVHVLTFIVFARPCTPPLREPFDEDDLVHG